MENTILMYKELSDKVLGAAFSVHNVLGRWLLESAYEGALCIELRRQGIAFEQQRVYPLYYKGELAGAYVADLVVEGKIILELKSVRELNAVSRKLAIDPGTMACLIEDFIRLKILRGFTGFKRNRIFVFGRYLKLFEKLASMKMNSEWL